MWNVSQLRICQPKLKKEKAFTRRMAHRYRNYDHQVFSLYVNLYWYRNDKKLHNHIPLQASALSTLF